jgi:nitrate reductase gamma subunit
VAGGVWYAYTLGMAPWVKESTRRHWKGYLRGVIFHVGIFVALAMLLASPWLEMIWPAARSAMAVLTGLGTAAGVGGMFARWSDENLRTLSTGDDHLSVLLVTLFLATATAALMSAGAMVAWYLVSAVMLAYLPVSKVRHCLYFFFSRWYFGRLFGRRDVIKWAGQHQ